VKNHMKHITTGVLVLLFVLNLFPQTLYGASEQNGYWVQTGVFRNQVNAEKHIERLKSAGFSPVQEKIGFFTIFIGPYSTRQEAQANVNKLKSLNFDGFIKNKSVSAYKEEYVSSHHSPLTTQSNLLAGNSQNYFLGTDIKLVGVIGSHTLFVQVDDHWKLKGNAYIDLTYKTTVISEYKHSTITVYVNDNPVKSFWIDDEEIGSKSVRIDEDMLKNGYNEVKFLTYHRLTDDLCEDDVNQANWVLLEKETYVHLEYEEISDSLKLNDFPYPFIKESRDFPVDFILTLPDELTEMEVSSAMMLAAYTGKVNRYKDVKVLVKKYKEIDKKDVNLIHICDVENIPEELEKFFTEQDKERLKYDAVIKKVISPFNSEKKILIIVSDNGKSLLKATEALTMSEIVGQMENDTEWINEVKEFVEIEKKSNEYIELNELGYADILFQGAKRGSAIVSVKVPQTWKLKEDARILIKFRYSEIVDYNKSSLSVFINNVPAGSKQFDEAYSQDDVVVLAIPKEVINDKNLAIRFEMSLIPQEYNCKAASYDKNLWGFISSDTVVYLPHEDKEKYSFDEYPAPFVDSGSLKDLFFILPDKMEISDIQNACNLVSFMGHELDRVQEIRVVYASKFSEAVHDGNLVVIGTPESNSMIKESNDKYNISYEEDWLGFEDFKEIKLLDFFKKNVGTIQLIESPYSVDKRALIVTGPNEKTVESAIYYLSDFELFNKLKGNTAFVSEEGAVRTGYVGIEEEDVTEDEFDDAVAVDVTQNISSDEIKRFVAIVGSTFILMMVFLIFAARSKKK